MTVGKIVCCWKILETKKKINYTAKTKPNQKKLQFFCCLIVFVFYFWFDSFSSSLFYFFWFVTTKVYLKHFKQSTKHNYWLQQMIMKFFCSRTFLYAQLFFFFFLNKYVMVFFFFLLDKEVDGTFSYSNFFFAAF